MPPKLSVFSAVKLYGERLGIIELADDELAIPEGLIVPDTALRQHYFVRVVAKGDGRWRSTERPAASIDDVNVGDVIMVQMNPQLINHYLVGNQPMVVMHWGDALAVVTDLSVPLSTRTVKPVGKWVFADLRRATKADNIFLPDDSSAAALTTHFVSSGKQSGVDLSEGTRLYVDISKASPFSLGDREELKLTPGAEGEAKVRKLAYVNCDYVLGTIE